MAPMGNEHVYDVSSPARWEFCFGRKTQLVDNIVGLVDNMGLGGVVMSYQYLYLGNQNDSGFLRGEEARTFVREVTTGLREKLGNGVLLTEMPLDRSVVVGIEYFSLTAELAQRNQFDMMMPRYSNISTLS